MSTDTKCRIRQKAQELFMRLGIRSVSMDDIASNLGVSKKTIYQYYADKDELVNMVMKDEEQSMHSDCERCRVNSNNAIEEIFLTIEMIYEQFSQMNPMIIHDLEKFHPDAFGLFQKMKNEYLYQVILNNIQRGIREELYRPELNADVMSKFRMESMMLSFNMSTFPPAKYNLAEVTREILEHFLYGLATLKGHKLILKYKQQQVKRIAKN